MLRIGMIVSHLWPYTLVRVAMLVIRVVQDDGSLYRDPNTPKGPYNCMALQSRTKCDLPRVIPCISLSMPTL